MYQVQIYRGDGVWENYRLPFKGWAGALKQAARLVYDDPTASLRISLNGILIWSN